jgi:hypothetical protein
MSFSDIRAGIAGKRTSHAPTQHTPQPGLPTGRPNMERGPSEQRTMNGDPPFTGGGRVANHEVDSCPPPDRPAADADYLGNLDRTARQNRENLGQMQAPLRKPHGPNT